MFTMSVFDAVARMCHRCTRMSRPIPQTHAFVSSPLCLQVVKGAGASAFAISISPVPTAVLALFPLFPLVLRLLLLLA